LTGVNGNNFAGQVSQFFKDFFSEILTIMTIYNKRRIFYNKCRREFFNQPFKFFLLHQKSFQLPSTKKIATLNFLHEKYKVKQVTRQECEGWSCGAGVCTL